MLDFLDLPYHLTPFQWSLAMLSAFILGSTKAGLTSLSTLNVALLAFVFGSKTSTGIFLPMLIVGDILAVLYYKRAVHWQSLIRLSPFLVIGVLLGAWIGRDLNEVIFKKLMAGIIILVVAATFWLENRPLAHISKSRWFSGTMGIATGFTSMVGNQASGFSTTYLMSMGLSKLNFIGTNAWLFFFLNIFKLPFHIFSWHTVNMSSIKVNACLLPFLFIGFYAGIFIVKQLNETRYRQVILWLTAIAALAVFI